VPSGIASPHELHQQPSGARVGQAKGIGSSSRHPAPPSAERSITGLGGRSAGMLAPFGAAGRAAAEPLEQLEGGRGVCLRRG